MMTSHLIDANESDVSILVLNEKSWEEFYCVSLPQDMPEKKRQAAERRLTSSGFQTEYKFDQKVVDRRSMSLAKAQAASMIKRIADKTGLQLVLGHGIHVVGK